VPTIESGYSSILQKNQLDWGHDMKFAKAASQVIKQKELGTLFKKVLDPV